MKILKGKAIFCALILSISLLDAPASYTSECTQKNSSGHCIRTSSESPSRVGKSNNKNTENKSKAPRDDSNDSPAISNDYQNWVNWFNNNYQTMTDETGAKIHARKTTNRRPGEPECYSENERPGKYTRIREKPITSDDTATYTVSCQPNDTKTLAPTNPTPPKGPTIEEMLQEVEDQFANTNIQAPVLKQSYNLGTGLGENNPNVYKNQAVNFYVDDGGPYRLEADMLAGHVEIELMPSSYVIEYGNGDTATNYTAGKPVTTYPRERPRQTDTSYAYQRSGNFHAYATVHYTARFRVDGGPWQMMMVTPQATSDPLLIRVWWVDVGRVGGTCEDDDTRWGCKNDPTMGKKDNPNPRLRKADIRTGQRWHLNDSGVGDTEYSLHRDWPDM